MKYDHAIVQLVAAPYDPPGGGGVRICAQNAFARARTQARAQTNHATLGSRPAPARLF